MDTSPGAKVMLLAVAFMPVYCRPYFSLRLVRALVSPDSA
jgi:hypothetical protein